MLALIGLLGLAPATTTPAGAQVDPPVLVIGGFTQRENGLVMQAWIDALNDAGYDAHPMELETYLDNGWFPGSAPMEEHGQAVQAKVNEILSNTSADTIQLVGISQGALAARHYINYLGGTTTVNGLISFAGVNGGISYENDDMPLVSFFLQSCFEDDESELDICDEIIFGDFSATIGDTEYLKELNGDDPPGNPTPGNIEYYHICSENQGTARDDIECWLPSGHAFTRWTAQELCNDPNYEVGHADSQNPVLQELFWAALERRQPSNAACP